jgi:hypothetical protein
LSHRNLKVAVRSFSRLPAELFHSNESFDMNSKVQRETFFKGAAFCGLPSFCGTRP